jgi:uncharacterized membrane protein YfbV (UPF0208 family)
MIQNYVTWTSFLSVVTAAIILGLGLNAFIWAQNNRTMDQFEKRMVEQFENVKNRLNNIDDKLEKR